MFQTFETTSNPAAGAARLAMLRAELARRGLDGFLIPRADAYQGEYVAPRDERLQWLTGFTGSAGFCIVLPDIAGVFIDGRYRTQVKSQVDLTHFTPVNWPETKPGDWIRDHLAEGIIGFDPWLHSEDEIARLSESAGPGITLKPLAQNPVDAIWPDQPAPPKGRAFAHPVVLAGETSAAKRARLGAVLRAEGQRAAVLTLPDSLCWLLNIRGADVPRNPVLHGYAILHDDARVSLFADPAKFDAATRAHLGPEVALAPPDAFPAALDALTGPVRLDRSFAPVALRQRLEAAGIAIAWGDDPCRLPKACKTEAEIAATREAHLRDVLVDSGGQYVDGTTDITRTIALGDPGDQARMAFTRVLQGMIAISRARFPKGLAGRDLDPLARAALWLAGQDYDHGTGHGVGAFLSVHEGPQRISRMSEVPLEPGMILSNEPGYYREGQFGIRIENLIVVQAAPDLPGGDDRRQYCFETLTFVPIDRRLIDVAMLSPGERTWLNAYHAETLAKLSPRLSAGARAWLEQAAAPL